MANQITSTREEQSQMMQRYYVMQSKIYDLTRWSFLFGRRALVRQLPLPTEQPHRILEVGCGTGYNLRLLARRFPKAQLYGLDVAGPMLAKAAKATRPYAQRVTLEERPYTLGETNWAGQMDAIIFSYALTMINPHWDELIQQAWHDLKPGGLLAVTDFHDSKQAWFKRHMSHHHVRMDGHLLPELEQRFEPLLSQVKPAYGGIWHYLVYIGKPVGK